jgi:hypothetical protein
MDFEVFQAFCGKDALSTVILGTTQWEWLPAERRDRREKDLQETFWGGMIAHGSRVERVEDTSESAQRVINLILGTVKSNIVTDTLQIQEELVQLRQHIPQTKAGRKLRDELQRKLQELDQVTDVEKRSILKDVKKLDLPFLWRINGVGSFFLFNL